MTADDLEALLMQNARPGYILVRPKNSNGGDTARNGDDAPHYWAHVHYDGQVTYTDNDGTVKHTHARKDDK